MIRIRKQEKDRKVERDESVGNVTAVVRLPAPAAGAVSKTLKSPQSLHSLGDMCRTTTVCHLDFTLFTNGGHLSSVRPVLILQSAGLMCSFD